MPNLDTQEYFGKIVTGAQNRTGLTSMFKYIKLVLLGLCLLLINCSKKSSSEPQPVDQKPIAGFSFKTGNAGTLPSQVNFTDSSQFAVTYKWDFGDGNTSTAQNPGNVFKVAKIYKVKLVVSNNYGKDSITKQITITLNKPKAAFSFKINTTGVLPANVTFTNSALQAASYLWDFNDGSTSTDPNPQHNYTNGNTYTVKLKVTNASGTDSISQVVNISPFPQAYVSFDAKNYNLYSWEGKYVTILMRTKGLNATTMFNWAHVMDSCYSFYKSVTGQEPSKNAATYLDNHLTIADVATTCGAGCGYVGAIGIEMQNTYTDRMYRYAQQNLYDQELFYETGRNFWFYSNQLQYKANDPVVTGYAVFMRFMAMDATGVKPAPFNTTPWATFRSAEEELVDTYVANTAYSWSNTLGAGVGIQNQLNLGATDLFSSFLIRLKRDYGGDAFVNNIWKQAALRPTAATTQDAVDNFILAACAAANKNLTTLFTVTWRWPMSDSAKTEAGAYP